jgi:hypothetical protein
MQKICSVVVPSLPMLRLREPPRLSGNASVTSDTSFSGNCSLRIEANDPAGQVAFNLPSNGNNSVIFVDFRLLPVATSGEEAASTTDAAGAQSGFLRLNAQGNLCAFDATGNGTWRDTGTKWTTNGDGTITQWVRLTMRLVPALHKWDLYADGKMVLADLGLIQAAQNKLVLFGDLHSPIYLDDLYAGAVNPLFVDLDCDGLPDGWVMSRTGGATISGSPRDWQDESAGGANLLQEYLTTVATLSISGELEQRKLVFVHPSFSSWGDLASLLKLLNTGAPRGGEEQAYLDGLARDLQHTQDAALAGLPAPSPWHIAVDIATALQVAEDGAEIVVFPGTDPYVWTGFGSEGKAVGLHCLEGAILSTPESVEEGQVIHAEQRAAFQSALTAIAGENSATALTQLWPASQ